MATVKSGRPTFPVWVGSLNEHVTEKDLRKHFSKFGEIASVKLKTDNATGKSLGFGWVNFCARGNAESAAAKMAGVSIRGGDRIKTSGPAELERKGLFSPEKVDYRPLTDCSFYIEGKHCKNGDACVYRHSAKALSTEAVCGAWQKRQCTKKRCPLRHPGKRSTSSSAGSPPPDTVAVAAGVQVCGGQCGDSSCSLSFSSALTLSQHIHLGQLQCNSCNMVCASQTELREHRKLCSKRSHKDSTSTATSSPPPSPYHSDIELLSDSESVASEDSVSVSSPYKHDVSAVQVQGGKRPGGEGEPGRGRKKRGKRGGQGRNKKAGVSGSSSAANVAETVLPKKTGTRKASSEVSFPPPPPAPPAPPYLTSDPTLWPGSADNVLFDIGSDSSESSDDEEDDLTYTSAEMAQLLSLNEQDMHPYSDSGGENSDVEGEGEGEGVGEVEKRKKRQGKKETGSDTRTATGAGGSFADSANPGPGSVPRQPRERTQFHSRQPEPVGLFWDIENCSVPANKSAFAVAAKMRRVFFEGKREAEFMVVCDITKERKEVTDALNKAQVTLVHVNAVAKNAADDKLRQSLRRFAGTYPAPSTVVLVSSDVNFSSELSDLRHVLNITIVLVHSRFTSDALKVFAHELVSYEKFLEDVEGPKGAQRSSLPNVLLVTNLPRNIPPKKVSSRLGQLSDNCGGRVLGVDPTSGTARILFRTPDWAMKAEKRMKGEDVFGFKINLCLDYSQPPQPTHPHLPHPPPHSPPHPLHPPPHSPPHPLHPPPHSPPRPLLPPHPPHPPPPHSQRHFPPPPAPHSFRHLSGNALGSTFPPARGPPPNHPPFQPSPPPPRPAHPFVPRPLIPGPNFPPGQSRGPPPNSQFHPPLNSHLPVLTPHTANVPSGPASYSKMAATPAPCPEGKILIFKIPATIEGNAFEELNRQVLSISLEACVKTERERVVMWHSFSELQVLLRLDFYSTAVVRKDELVKGLWEKGDLKPNVAKKFLEQCVTSVSNLCSQRGLPWQVTSCGWTEDEESDRLTRSQVISLLKRYPLCWVNWSHFKQKYHQVFHSALSEMAVHTSCKGAVMILGKPDNNESQVIIRYEMSPLVRISPQKKVCSSVLNKVIAMLAAKPDRRIKLLDVVRQFTDTVGPLPLSVSGRPLQEVLSGSPQLRFVGSKPSSIYLSLTSSVPEKRVVSPTPKRNTKVSDLDKLATEFRHLLKMQSPDCELPLSRLQQEYQTLYHRSFRVADYVVGGEGGKMRALVEACSGIQVRDVILHNNKVETVVFLESEPARARVQQVRKEEKQQPQSVPQSPPQPLPDQTDSVADCERRVHDLLCGLPNYQITMDKILAEYEKKYGRKLSYYGHGKLTSLLESFHSTVILSDMKGPTRLVQLQPIHVLTHELTLLLAAHGGKLSINQIVPEYKEMFDKLLVISEYGFSKLIRALEAMADTVTLTGKGASRIAVLKKPVSPGDTAATRQLGDEVMALLMSTHSTKLPVVELTRRYNEIFITPGTGRQLPPFTAAEMVDILKKMPSFSVTGGSDPVQYVSLVQRDDKEKEKEKAEVSQKQQPADVPPSDSASLQSSVQQVSTTVAEPVMADTSSRKLYTPSPPPQPLATTFDASSGSGASTGGGGGGGGSGSGPGAVGDSSDTTDKAGEGGGTGEGGEREEGESGVTLCFSDRESQRLASETQRLLQCHQEHAMTVSELVQSFEEAGDPALPRPEELSLCLHKHNVRKGSKLPRLFQISSIPGSVGDSLIQLNRSDCHSKLSLDLLHLFVYQPTHRMTHLVNDMCRLYQQCHGHKLVPAVYGMRTVVGIIEAGSYVNGLMKLDDTKQVCSLTDVGCRRVMSSLLVELLFLRGESVGSTAHLPQVFRQHFGFPLPLDLLKVETPTALLAIPEIQNFIQVNDDRPVLKEVTRFAEQLRILLTENNGRLSLDSLPGLFTAAFGPPPDTGGRQWLENKLVRYAPHVVNLTSNKWVIWAPAGKPYPPRKSAEWRSVQSSPPSPALHMPAQHTREVAGSQVSSQQSKILPVSSEALLLKDVMTMEEGIGGRVSVKEENKEAVICSDPSPLPREVPDTSSVLLDLRLQLDQSSHHTAYSTSYDSSITEGVDRRRAEAGMQQPSENTQYPPSLPQIFNMSQEPLIPLPALSNSTATHTSSALTPPSAREEKVVECDASPYGFLERDPDLLAQLTIKEEDSENALSTADALQQLIEAGSTAYDPSVPDLPPPIFPVSTQASGGEGTSHTKSNVSPLDKATDYLEAGLSPDQVLQELYRVKETSGGILNPSSMEPFLSYFGELSRRELERLESQHPTPKKTPSPTPTKGMLRNKRMMAIRFPGQGPDPNDIDAELQKKLESIQLPEIPSLSDNSDDSDSEMVPLTPFTHAELLQKLMNKDCLTFKESSVTGGSPGTSPLLPPPPSGATGGGADGSVHTQLPRHVSDLQLPTSHP